MTRPDISFEVNVLSSEVAKGTISTVKAINRIVKKAKSSKNVLRFSRLGDLSDISVRVYADASFGNQADKIRSTAGRVILIQNKKTLFSCCDKFEIEAFQVMQNRAARLVTHSQPRTSRKVIFSLVGWMTVNQLMFYFSALSTFRIRQTQEPEYLNNIMSRDNRAGNIIVPNTNLTLAKNSYCYRASTQWNTLPEQIRILRRISQFKSQLKKWILENVPQFVDT
jgi:hypothetical protein